MQQPTVTENCGDCELPTNWTVFGPVGRDTPEPDFTALAKVPAKLVIAGQHLTAQPATFKRSPLVPEVDLAALLGGRKEGRTGYLLTTISADREMDVTLGASADWWMKWWVNGQIVCDTLKQGNGRSPTCLRHVFTAHLKSGQNLVAVKVVSGSAGFALKAGGTRELRAEQEDAKLLTTKVMADAPLLLVPPRIRVFAEPELLPERSDFTMSSGIARTPAGRLWVSWFGGEDGQKAFLMLASSDDDGRSWSLPRYIIREPPTPNGFCRSVLGGNLWTDPQGRLWCFFTYYMGYCDGRQGMWASVCGNPDAAELDWSTPRRLGHGFVLNKPIILRTGAWLLPTSLWDRELMGLAPGDWANNHELFRELDPWRMTNFLASVDNGATWERRGGVFTPEREFDEPSFIQQSDGELRCLIRTHYGLAETRSFDDGFNWSKPEPSRLRHPSARLFTLRLRSGRILLVKHGPLFERTGRSHLTAYLSDDDGETWRGGLMLDERQGVSYPDGFQAPDGRIYVAYDRKRIEGEILLAVFTEADVLAGRAVSLACRLKIPVQRTAAVCQETRTTRPASPPA